MVQTPLNFKSKSLTLEGVITTPQGLASPWPGAVLCHPHPAFGGNMENPVIMALVRSLAQAGLASLRFNFRGVGSSQGAFAKGNEEPQDLRAALALFRGWPGIHSRRVALVGYSFGAQIILRGLEKLKEAKTLALISPPLPSIASSSVTGDRRPKLFLVGDRDRVVSEQSLRQRVASLQEPSDIMVVSGADHSWRGHEEEVAQLVTQFLGRTL